MRRFIALILPVLAAVLFLGGHRNVSRELRHFREAAAAHFARRHGDGEAAALYALVLDFGRKLRRAA